MADPGLGRQFLHACSGGLQLRSQGQSPIRLRQCEIAPYSDLAVAGQNCGALAGDPAPEAQTSQNREPTRRRTTAPRPNTNRRRLANIVQVVMLPIRASDPCDAVCDETPPRCQHLAIAAARARDFWWSRLVSNQRPSACEMGWGTTDFCPCWSERCRMIELDPFKHLF